MSNLKKKQSIKMCQIQFEINENKIKISSKQIKMIEKQIKMREKQMKIRLIFRLSIQYCYT